MRTIAPDVKVTDGALTQIVVRAAEAVDGARVRRPRRKVEVAIENGRARVDLELAVAFGKVLPEVARDVQREVADALTRMCELAVDAVDVSVEELE
ncbi:MAG TPA: Asp23/Gls24 family envelope stress response protein [Gaiellaceae bacterium]